MADPDLQIRGGRGHPDPEIRRRPGLKKKKFFRPFGPPFGLKIRRGAGPRAPPLGPLLVLSGPMQGESEFRNPGKFCFWNPVLWALESRIQLKE